jgi:hypothetical protein
MLMVTPPRPSPSLYTTDPQMLMKNDYIPFQVQPVAGYTDLFAANDRLVQNNYDVLLLSTRN